MHACIQSNAFSASSAVDSADKAWEGTTRSQQQRSPCIAGRQPEPYCQSPASSAEFFAGAQGQAQSWTLMMAQEVAAQAFLKAGQHFAAFEAEAAQVPQGELAEFWADVEAGLVQAAVSGQGDAAVAALSLLRLARERSQR